MLRDWLLTLLVLTPTFLALLIVLFALLGRIAHREPARSTVVEPPHPDGGRS